MELLRLALNSVGLDLRESDAGMTIFPSYSVSGSITPRAIFYIGAMGSDINDESKWKEIMLPDGY